MKPQPLTASLLLIMLVSGTGIQASTPDASIAHGTFQPVGNMTTPRDGPTATVLTDGTVLVAGGSASTHEGARGLRSAKLFDPATCAFAALVDPVTGKVSPTGSMISAFGVAPTLLPDGRVLVLGGRLRKLMAEVYVP